MNEITGLRFVGYANHLRVNYGQPLPLFEPVESEGSPSINTAEGWMPCVKNKSVEICCT